MSNRHTFLAIAALGVAIVAALFANDLQVEGWAAMSVTWFALLAASDS